MFLSNSILTVTLGHRLAVSFLIVTIFSCFAGGRVF